MSKVHSEIKSRRQGKRRKGILWDYNFDGMYSYEQLKGFWKAYWKRWSRRLRKEESDT